MNQKIELTFASSAGDLVDEFSLNQPLHAVERVVLGKLGLDPSQADDFVVTLNGAPLEESKKLGELGLEDGTVLTIERRNVTKICGCG